MKKINYKIIATIVLILSLLMLIILINDSICNYIRTIGISIAINLISSVIIIYLIDIKKEKEEQENINEKRKIVYRKLIIPIGDFDNFILNMYKSTTTKNEMEEFVYDVNNVEKIIKNIKLINNEKDSYIYDINLKRTQTWKETIITQILDYIYKLEKFYEDNSYILSNNLNKSTMDIISIKSNDHIVKHILQLNASISTENLLKVFNLEKIILSTFYIKSEILRVYDANTFKINKENLLRNDISPKFKSGI